MLDMQILDLPPHMKHFPYYYSTKILITNLSIAVLFRCNTFLSHLKYHQVLTTK